MQRRILIPTVIFTLTLIALSPFASAQNKATRTPSAAGGNGLGAGIVIGIPTAVTGKYFLDQKNAVDGGLAIGFNDTLLLYGDFLIHFRGAFGRSNEFLAQTTPYLGGGGIFAIATANTSNDNGYRGKNSGALGLGVRVPFGAEWKIPDPSLGVFVELAPGIALMPQTVGIFHGGVGIRYYF